MAYQIKVVGVTKENEDGVNRQTLLPLLAKDGYIAFKPEPENRYDDQAIAIVNRNGETLGYVPADYYLKEQLFRAVRCGFYEFDVAVDNLKDPTKLNAKGGKKYSWGLDIAWDYRLMKDGDYEDVASVIVKRGKHPSNRYDLDKAHKAKEIRRLVDHPVHDKVYRRMKSKQRRKLFKNGVEITPFRQNIWRDRYVSDEDAWDEFYSRPARKEA